MMTDSPNNLAIRARMTSSSGAAVGTRPQMAPGHFFLRKTLATLCLGALALGFAGIAHAQSFTQSITYSPAAAKGFYDTIELFLVGDPADAFVSPGLTAFNDAKPSAWTSRLRDRRTAVAGGIAPGTTAPSPMTFSLNLEGAAHAVVVDMVVWDGGTSGTVIDTVRFLTDGAGGVETVPITESMVGWAGAPEVFVKRGNINIPAVGAANQYPTQIKVRNVGLKVSRLTVELKGLIHTRPSDLQVLLVGPTGVAVLLMGDVGGTSPVNGINLVFDDAATKTVPTTGLLAAGTYKPTVAGSRAKFPVPAPAAPYATTLAAFNGTPADGTWSLYILDDLAGASGNLKVGWALSIQ